jgi:hypothetical protein
MQYNRNPVSPMPQPDVPGYGDLGQDFGRQRRYFNHQFTPANPPAAVAPIAPITTMPIINDYGGGMAAGGPVEAMSAANVYDMQNARGGVSDMGIDNSTGMQRMAGGGITGSGELNLNIPLDFGGGAVGGFGQGQNGAGLNINQGPLDLGQRNTGFGQAGVNGYTAAGSGAGSGASITGQSLNRSMAAPFGPSENPFSLGTQLASRLGSELNQNPFSGQPTQEMMAAQRKAQENIAYGPEARLSDLSRRAGDKEQSFDEFKRMRGVKRHPEDRVPTEAELQSMYQNYVQDRNDSLTKMEGLQKDVSSQNQQKAAFDQINALQNMMAGYGGTAENGYMSFSGNGLGGGLAAIRRQLGGNLDGGPTAHVVRPGTNEYNNHIRGAGDSTFGRFAAGGAIPSHSASHLGDYSDGGRLLKGPGDGVSDDIPAMIGEKQPARLADGEFVVPARIVSELGNGSTEAGARKLYAMMDRVQQNRQKTVGKDRVAVNSRSDKYLPA